MQLQFDPNQGYQVQAVESVATLFEGQARYGLGIDFRFGLQQGALANRLDLTADDLLKNLRAVQGQNGLPVDDRVQVIDAAIDTAGGQSRVKFCNFSVEMETGTGKTYVYVRTALELFKRYGMAKFVIVVPSVAIREGVMKTFAITETHFGGLFPGMPYRYYAYNSEDISQVRQFALSDAVEFMVMTIDSFNKASNVIRQTLDQLQGATPLHLIQAARPILILDEPQNMESELRVQSLATLNPLFALRYSATHRNPYSLVYQLTPLDAYRQGLVKRIEVASVLREGEVSQAFVQLQRIDVRGRKITARLVVRKLMKGGNVKERAVIVRPGDSLEKKTARPEYAEYTVDEINPGSSSIRFANNLELRLGESTGTDKEAIFAAQIQYTVEEHFRKQEKLKNQGVKVLSLFFIDRVDNYARLDGVIRTLFERSFEELKTKYDDWKSRDVAAVQASYFAKRRHRDAEDEPVDSTTGVSLEDEAAYNLIMRDKERLLDRDEPVAFIFSHSALREGWDNPNVFQICTLNQTISDLKKRQEVGRGMRLALDQSGARVHDPQVNVLTVVANESYEHYVEQLQSEMETEYGKQGVAPRPANARQRGQITLRKEFLLRRDFKELWERIRSKTRYAVTIDTNELLRVVVPAVDRIKVRPLRVAITKAQVRIGKDDTLEALQISAAKTVASLVGRYPLPDLVELMANLMENTTPPVRVTRATLLALLSRTKNMKAALTNPQQFAVETVRLLKEALADQLANGIRYDKTGDWYELSGFEEEITSWRDYLVPAERSVYDHVEFESNIEHQFVLDLEKRDDVRLYVKLPHWFTVTTPVGEYNPDWAIVMEDRDPHGKRTKKPLLYLVRETKDPNFMKTARATEKRKVVCGQRHFEGALNVSFRVVSKVSELP
ncbi:MAG: DEAD/DEAH box helicase family protein [Actinomycetota bacterium]|nr:DEAD/DEAH box helicase family protein [Actinomycetota bacterium]